MLVLRFIVPSSIQRMDSYVNRVEAQFGDFVRMASGQHVIRHSVRYLYFDSLVKDSLVVCRFFKALE